MLRSTSRPARLIASAVWSSHAPLESGVIGWYWETVPGAGGAKASRYRTSYTDKWIDLGAHEKNPGGNESRPLNGPKQPTRNGPAATCGGRGATCGADPSSRRRRRQHRADALTLIHPLALRGHPAHTVRAAIASRMADARLRPASRATTDSTPASVR